MSSGKGQPTIEKFFTKVDPFTSRPSTRGKAASSLLDSLREECSVDSDKSSDDDSDCAFSPLDIVWAIYSNYPSWPAIVCKDLATDKYFDESYLHVQFFDNPPTLAWVPLKGVRALKASDVVENKRPEWKKKLTRALAEAKVALSSSKAQKAELVKPKRTDESEDDNDSTYNNSSDESTDGDSDWSETPEKTVAKKMPNPAKKPNPAKRLKMEPEPDEDELSEYEKIRLKNIREREALFKSLNIGACKEQLNTNFKKPTAPKRGLSQPLPPSRRSRRILIMGADAEAFKENIPLDGQDEDEEERRRLPLKALNMDEAVVTSSSDVSAAAEEEGRFLKTLCDQIGGNEATKTLHSASFKSPYASSQALTIKETGVVKVVPDRIFTMAVHPSHSKLLVAVGSKNGYVGLWDARDTESESNGVHLFKPHSRPVNAMEYDKYNPLRLITTSYDGTIRCLDMEKGQFDLLYGQPEESDHTAAYHVQLDANTFLSALGAKGCVSLIDTRVANDKPASIYDVFSREVIKTLDVHPLNRNHLLCSTNRGGCAVFDLRGWSTPDHGKEPVMIFGGHKKSLSSAFYSPLTGKSVCTVSFDDHIRVFSTEEGCAERTALTSFFHNNQTGRWLTTFKASWHPLREDLFAVGSLRQPRVIELYSDLGEPYPNLKGENLNSVCSIVKFHPSREVIVGGNSSGRVHMFADDL